MRVAPLAIALALAAAPAIAKPSRAEPIPLKKGLPRKEGLSRLVIVSNLAGRDARFRAVKKLAALRDAKILKFKGAKVETVRKALARAGPEVVAFAVSPETVDINFHFNELSRKRRWRVIRNEGSRMHDLSLLVLVQRVQGDFFNRYEPAIV